MKKDDKAPKVPRVFAAIPDLSEHAVTDIYMDYKDGVVGGQPRCTVCDRPVLILLQHE
jgi:hypothetical protein